MSVVNLTPALVLLLALLIDRWLGEPPARLHPVVWVGHYLGWAGRRLQRITQPEGVADDKVFWLAGLYWCVGAALFSGASWGLAQGIQAVGLMVSGVFIGDSLVAASLSQLGAAVLLALLLKPLLAWAMLKSEVLAVEVALTESLAAGRARLSWLVSRDTAALTETQVRESAIESLAENLNDSVVAPIFWFVLAGLPGAALYRFANTADAMWGYKGVYKGQNWEWAGKWAARADDLLSWLPARLTGLLLAVLYRVPLRCLYPQARQTPSPNSGWPMAAMALALNIRLGKPGVYTLNPTGSAPQQVDTQRAITYASKVLLALVLIALSAIYLIAFFGTEKP
jgi:adenosylcobinamide-phosphate synthase